MRITNQVVHFSLSIWNPSPPLRFPPAVLPSSIHQQKDALPVPVLTHIAKIGDGALGIQPSQLSPLLSTYLSGPGKVSVFRGVCLQNSFRAASGGGAFPGYFITGDSTTARMMPWRLAQRWLTKLSLPDIEQACGGGDMPLGERLLWKRSALPLKISGELLQDGARNKVVRGDHVCC